jgi:hypothetical protein
MGQSNIMRTAIRARNALLDDDSEEDAIKRQQRDGGGPGGAHVSERRMEDEHVDDGCVHDDAAERGLQDLVVETLRLKELAHDLEDAIGGERDGKHAHVTGERRVFVRGKRG